MAAPAAAALLGALCMRRYAPPPDAFYAFCVERRLAAADWMSTPAAACARRSTTASVSHLLPISTYQPWTANDLGIATLVTTHENGRYLGVAGGWWAVPGLVSPLLGLLDVGADVVRIALALAALGVLGGIIYVCYAILMAVVGVVALWFGLLVLERHADTSRAASCVVLLIAFPLWVNSAAHAKKKNMVAVQLYRVYERLRAAWDARRAKPAPEPAPVREHDD